MKPESIAFERFATKARFLALCLCIPMPPLPPPLQQAKEQSIPIPAMEAADPYTAIITWTNVDQPKLTTYRVYHSLAKPPAAGIIPKNATAIFEIGKTNRFIQRNLNRTKTNHWAVTYLIDLRRIVGQGVYGTVKESEISNWVTLQPATITTVQPPRNMRSPK